MLLKQTSRKFTTHRGSKHGASPVSHISPLTHSKSNTSSRVSIVSAPQPRLTSIYSSSASSPATGSLDNAPPVNWAEIAVPSYLQSTIDHNPCGDSSNPSLDSASLDGGETNMTSSSSSSSSSFLTRPKDSTPCPDASSSARSAAANDSVPVSPLNDTPAARAARWRAENAPSSSSPSFFPGPSQGVSADAHGCSASSSFNDTTQFSSPSPPSATVSMAAGRHSLFSSTSSSLDETGFFRPKSASSSTHLCDGSLPPFSSSTGDLDDSSPALTNAPRKSRPNSSRHAIGSGSSDSGSSDSGSHSSGNNGNINYISYNKASSKNLRNQTPSSPFSMASDQDSHINPPFDASEILWTTIREEAVRDAESEPMLSSFLFASVLSHDSFARALAFVLSNRIADSSLLPTQMFELFYELLTRDDDLRCAALADIAACRERDPACASFSQALLYFKGYHALQIHRVAHSLWQRGQRVLALALQSRMSEVCAVDIHPAARIGKGVLLDHGTGIVIGETVIIGNNVSILQNVTLGGTGKEVGDRHPKVSDNVLIGASATVLGNIRVGKGAQVAAGSLVLKPVPPHTLVAGSPAKAVGQVQGNPAQSMEHHRSSLMRDDATEHLSPPIGALESVDSVSDLMRREGVRAQGYYDVYPAVTADGTAAAASTPSASSPYRDNQWLSPREKKAIQALLRDCGCGPSSANKRAGGGERERRKGREKGREREKEREEEKGGEGGGKTASQVVYNYDNSQLEKEEEERKGRKEGRVSNNDQQQQQHNQAAQSGNENAANVAATKKGENSEYFI